MHQDSVSTNKDSAKSCRECMLRVAGFSCKHTHPLWKECSLSDSVNSIPSPYIFLTVTLEWPKLHDSYKKKFALSADLKKKNKEYFATIFFKGGSVLKIPDPGYNQLTFRTLLMTPSELVITSFILKQILKWTIGQKWTEVDLLSMLRVCEMGWKGTLTVPDTRRTRTQSVMQLQAVA